MSILATISALGRPHQWPTLAIPNSAYEIHLMGDLHDDPEHHGWRIDTDGHIIRVIITTDRLRVVPSYPLTPIPMGSSDGQVLELDYAIQWLGAEVWHITATLRSIDKPTP